MSLLQQSKVVYAPIGVVASGFDEPGDPKSLRNAESVLVLDEKYIGALDGLARFKFILVVYHIDRSPGYHERVHPMGEQSIPERGVLATRSPCRPNPIGITVAEILSIEGNKIKVTGLDALNGTPILDIKPYEEHFDSPSGIEMEKDPGYKPEEAQFEKLDQRNKLASIVGLPSKK
jgi:tRNA-Thr(GGU) m(6)t(6)A37 methyltransferase TsaA